MTEPSPPTAAPNGLHLHVTVADYEREEIEWRLLDLGAVSVAVIADHPGQITATFIDRVVCTAAVAELGPGRTTRIEQVAEHWVDRRRRDQAVVRVGPFRIGPAGSPTGPDEVAVDIDPGSAFGDGVHMTTRLVLDELIEHPPTGLRVLDVGTGTGVLAVVAAQLGAAEVAATDLDPAAIAAATVNITANGVGSSVQLVDPLQPPDGPWDVVLANIVAGDLIAIAEPLLGWTCAGGRLVLSGILDERAPAVERAFAAAQIERRRSVNGWTCLVLNGPGQVS